jgi:hypothetical protein
MPDYGVQGPDEGSGLLPWSWAEERLTRSRSDWVTSRWPDGRPHSMPVCAAWDGEALWFSSGPPLAQGAEPHRRPAVRGRHRGHRPYGDS